ncbi:MAG: four helix bundle protein [Flavobacteriales bacterium]|nr:four helix bundle protein [Flavobacteriales bacterium]
MAAKRVQDTKVYQLAFKLAMEVFEVSKKFPGEEKYSLTDQIRRCTRSVCANLSESYRKKQYTAHFVSKVSDADMENAETQTWLEFALACQYMNKNAYQDLTEKSEEIGKLLNHMIHHPEKY